MFVNFYQHTRKSFDSSCETDVIATNPTLFCRKCATLLYDFVAESFSNVLKAILMPNISIPSMYIWIQSCFVVSSQLQIVQTVAVKKCV